MPANVILGVSCFHGDSAAALIVDGRLVAAAEEERFSRLKHTAAFPTLAIAYCLKAAGLTARDVQVLALPGAGGNLAAKVGAAVRHPVMAARSLMAAKPPKPLDDALAQCGLGHAIVQRFEHHLAHMASVRPLGGDDMLLVTIDGLGDFVSASYGASAGHGCVIKERITFPNSLGFFYTALTHHLGFLRFGEEFKVMGLSSFGKPRYLDALRQVIRTGDGFNFTLDPAYFPVAAKGVPFSVKDDVPHVAPFHDAQRLGALLGVPARAPADPLTQAHRDLAQSLQRRFEEVADHLLAAARKASPAAELGLAGGCAHNSVWVGTVAARREFRQVHVAPASNDSGLAVGAAVLAFGGKVGCAGGHWALLGPDEHYTGSAAGGEAQGTGTGAQRTGAAAGASGGAEHGFAARRVPDDQALQAWMAEEIAAGKILGLFRGRMEFGPRALGSRSILCDPRGEDMRDRLNARVKHREAFRPFAAAVLAEAQDDWFEGSAFSPSMEAVFNVKQARRREIPAVTHADGTCRLQSVVAANQPFLHGLLTAFAARTGVPMLINTSFNDSEPIVCTPQEALDCFARTEMDHIVIGDTVYSRGAVLAKAR